MGEGAWNSAASTANAADNYQLSFAAVHDHQPRKSHVTAPQDVPPTDPGDFIGRPLPSQMQLPSQFPAIQDIFVGPSANEHAGIDQALAGANKSLHAEWFRITDPATNNAIVAAKRSGSDVGVIEDNKNMSTPSSQQALDILKNGGVDLQLSSNGFDITHSKAAAIDSTTDGKRTIIGSMNMTGSNSRDIEFITNDSGIYNSMESIYNTDMQNAKNGTTDTPSGLDPAMVVSPVNAEDKLAGLIYSVDPDPKKGWIIADSENWGDPVIQKALEDAAAHGIPVKVLGPEIDENPNQYFNYPHLKELQDNGVQARWMPNPCPGESKDNPIHPYEHLKTIVVMTPNGPVGYLGSINFSHQSAGQVDASSQSAGQGDASTPEQKYKPNRELGILFNDPKAINAVETVFNQDFNNADTIPAVSPAPPPKPKPAEGGQDNTNG